MTNRPYATVRKGGGSALTMRKGDTEEFVFDFWTLGGTPYVVTGLTIWFTVKQYYSDSDGAAKIAKKTGTGVVHFGGTQFGPFNISSSNNQLSIKINGGSAQNVSLTTGSARTSQQVADEINAATTGFNVTVVNNLLTFDGDVGTTSIELVAVANSAYSTLGLTVGIYSSSTGIAIVANPRTGVANSAEVTVNPTDTASLPFKGLEGFYDLQLKDGAGRVSTCLSGPFSISPDVTNATS